MCVIIIFILGEMALSFLIINSDIFLYMHYSRSYGLELGRNP